MSFFSFWKAPKINDELIGKDEKVCSCSVRIAQLLQKSTANDNHKKSLRQTLLRLRTPENHGGKDRK